MRLLGWALFLLLVTTAVLTSQSRIPPGFKAVDDLAAFWDPPWVYYQSGVENAIPVPTLRLRGLSERKPTGYWSVPVRFDDGTTGTFRVAPYSSLPKDIDHARIQVRSPSDRVVSETDWYAAYGQLSITPIDLLGGPGDELIIVEIKTHASPPTGHSMAVWTISTPTPTLISQPLDVANLFASEQIGCARWKSVALVDMTTPKPRSLLLQPHFAASLKGFPPDLGCRPAKEQVRTRRRDRRVVFDGSRYLLR